MGARAWLRRLALTALLAGRAAAAAAADAEALALIRAASEQDSECSDAPSVSEGACLAKRGCMWLQLDTKNLCLPCQWGSVEVPCAPSGAAFPAGRVQRCKMSCAHQQVITKVSTCTDVSGDISMEDCRNKGTSSLVKCMWTAYKTREGNERSMCGPCFLDGTGKIPRYPPSGAGPEKGSIVTGSMSMCDEAADKYGLPCDPVNSVPPTTKCRPTPAPVLPGGYPLPVPLASLGVRTSEGAPEYVAVPVAAPYGVKEYTDAANAGARVAGWPVGSFLPPTAKVAMYGSAPFEGPYLPRGIGAVYQPPPPGILGIDEMPGVIGTAPPPINEVSAKASLLLMRSRRRGALSWDT